jgi:hypothetical protein
LIKSSAEISHKSDFALNIGSANSSRLEILVIVFKASAIFISSLVVVADLNSKLSDKIHASIIFQIFSSISNDSSLYILYKIEQVELTFSILIFNGIDVVKSTL